MARVSGGQTAPHATEAFALCHFFVGPPPADGAARIARTLSFLELKANILL